MHILSNNNNMAENTIGTFVIGGEAGCSVVMIEVKRLVLYSIYLCVIQKVVLGRE